MLGYSDRINHALAFAAKHHDQQVRKGTRLPYVTRAPNVAVILTRYACDETTVVSGILQDVVDDYLRDGWTRAMLDARLGEKFGADVLDITVAAARRRLDDDGNEFDREERNIDYLERLGAAPDASRWVCAADHVHWGNALLADLRRTVDAPAVWTRQPGGREAVVSWFQVVHDRLVAVGFDAPIMGELGETVRALAAA